jgi:uncharacterized protein YjlB
MAAAIVSPVSRARSTRMPMQTEAFILPARDWVPNNPRLPVRIYRSVRGDDGALLDADGLEARFARNGWPPQWRSGIYDYHHYHATAHEVLGVFIGHARLLLGGPGATEVTVQPGDVVLLPAGTGHCCLQASRDFRVVGAYPQGQDWDIQRAAPDAALRARMAALPDPPHDPVTG